MTPCYIPTDLTRSQSCSPSEERRKTEIADRIIGGDVGAQILGKRHHRPADYRLWARDPGLGRDRVMFGADHPFETAQAAPMRCTDVREISRGE